METETQINIKEIMAKLAKLQADMDYVKEHVADLTLSEEDLADIEEAEKEFQEGKTTSLEDLKKELEQ